MDKDAPSLSYGWDHLREFDIDVMVRMTLFRSRILSSRVHGVSRGFEAVLYVSNWQRKLGIASNLVELFIDY